MKILFAASPSIALVAGGLKRQMLETAKGLELLGHSVLYLSPDRDIHDLNPDIIHFFGAHPEHYHTLLRLKDYPYPTVLSPVFFTRRSAAALHGLITIHNWFSKTPLLSMSELQMRQRTCELASHLLPNTVQEATLISRAFSLPENKMTVIPNGAETDRFLHASADLYLDTYPWREFILYVGDLTAERKNVLQLIKAYTRVKASDSLIPPLILAGTLGRSAYASEIRKRIDASDSIHWIGPIDHQDPMLPSLYHAARIFILPSYFETPGIAALEAALCGCNIVITQFGGTQDVFGDYASYVDPGSVSSIAMGIREAVYATKNSGSEILKDIIRTQYDWKKIAAKTAEVYTTLIS